MERSFRALKNREGREAYLEAEIVNGLARQIKIIRQQRGWSQEYLASLMGTTQNTICRLEDPSYGKYTLSTLLGLAKIFDVALFTRFMPFSKFMHLTWNTKSDQFEADSYEDEVDYVGFYSESAFKKYVVEEETATANSCYATQNLLLESSKNKILDNVVLSKWYSTLYHSKIFEISNDNKIVDEGQKIGR